eukprot:CAMPEP_0204881954 /NCGR_PEP_ID=MMETSP1349-20130617/3115_1 /ASSEMBLY_ACC=CAM_ASM_000710 /TAXON_ID=215587 /ORGANISM="Aplanochytrium stocchinoi, Strain GSBS06" /LENGTH=138 /DNA_ID=CAMNT_0052041139 /DNA_START=331 /DNA_END=747 /DNA_ORIENTATION=-
MTSFQVNLIRWGSAFVVLLGVWISFRTIRLIAELKQPERTPKTNMFPSWYLCPSLVTGKWILVFLGIFLLNYGSAGLTNYAVLNLELFLYQTLISVGPLYAMPVLWLMTGERVSFRGTLGTLVAVSGLVILCLQELIR